MIAKGLTLERRRPLPVRNDVLRIAVPNKGSLSEPAIQLLSEAGYKQRRDSRELVLVDQRNEVEFFFLRPRDVAVYVGLGTVDAGITGRDLLLDCGADAIEHLELGLRRLDVPLRGARRTRCPRSTQHRGQARRDLLPAPRAEPPHDLRRRGEVVRLDGAVESSVRLGVADVVADVVSTGEDAARRRARRSSATPSSSRRRSSSGAPTRRERTSRRSRGACAACSWPASTCSSTTTCPRTTSTRRSRSRRATRPRR